MNILYLCHRFPFPPQRGGKIRPFNMIRHLSASGHRVTVCSLVRSAQEAHEGQGLAPYCDGFEMAPVTPWAQTLRMVARLPTPTPSSMGYFYSPAMAAQVQRLLATRSWDLVMVHCSSVAPYVAQLREVPKLLDFGDMDSQKWREYARYKPFPLSLGYGLEGVKLQAAEQRLARRFDLCTTTTQAEWRTLQSYATGADAHWFPNGVDAGYFCPTDAQYDPDTISFIGRMDYYPNQAGMAWFCAQVWPVLKRRFAGLKLLVVGADPSPAMRQLGDLPGVTVTGSVPDVRPYIRRSALMVAPLQIARGTQNKLLEAMAMGVPVVTSRLAGAGVDAQAGTHLQVADSPADYVQAITALLAHPAERARFAQAGRQRMLSHHAWPHAMARLDDLMDRSIRNYTMSKGVVA